MEVYERRERETKIQGRGLRRRKCRSGDGERGMETGKEREKNEDAEKDRL